jgi:hypothetical protein
MDNKEQKLYLHKIDPSNFYFYSVGFLAKDKDWDSDIVEVFPIEKLPTENGELAKEETLQTNASIGQENGKEINTTPETIVLKRGNTIKAKWLSLGQYNRVTPPDIRKGEQVLIFKYGNADLYFWTTMFNDVSLRKEEIVRYVFSDKPQLDPEEDLDSTYYMEVNTRDKILKLHTTDKWGELTTYDIILDTKNGSLQIIDGKTNSITLDSSLDTLTVKTNLTVNIISGAAVNVTSSTVNVVAGLVNIKSKRCNINP